jgi:hypothetical protein
MFLVVILYSVAQHPKFLMKNSIPTCETSPLIIENLVVSNNPDTPCRQNNNVHSKWKLEFILDVIDCILNTKIPVSLRTQMIPTSDCKGTC